MHGLVIARPWGGRDGEKHGRCFCCHQGVRGAESGALLELGLGIVQ